MSSLVLRIFSLVALWVVLLSTPFVANAQRWDRSKMRQENGETVVYCAKPIDRSLINPWPQELEDEFQRRAHTIVTLQRQNEKAKVNTYFENEKRGYGFLMAHLLDGNEEPALKYLQGQDHQHELWHRETDGIDYYACFTLKHQMRKYFYFGDLLDDDYRRQMFSGAKKWTALDPMKRPHYAFNKSSGWGPDAKNSWVDVRSTENLFLMRVTSVYLMAEETGNQATTQQYKKKLLQYTEALLRVGIGEWDSENYHGHSIAPLLNLYDFAKDNEVKLAAKHCLDFFAAAGAIKYWRGAFNGPTKRDYNHVQPFGGSAANSLWVWFGDHPTGKTGHWESDEIHQITSAYRPPVAVVNLAKKNFTKPVEIFAAKPSYGATTGHQLDSDAEYLETQYIANSFQMGSLTNGTSVDGGDVNGFKVLVWDKEQGALALHAAPTSEPSFAGSPLYKKGIIAAENRVAQQGNLAIWLVKNSKSPWTWVIPKDIKVSHENGITFLQADRAWVAVRGLGTSEFKVDQTLTDKLMEEKSHFPGHIVVAASGNREGGYCGLAVEIGEQQSHGSFAKFKSAVKSAVVDISELSKGVARYRASDGKHLGIHWNDDPMKLGVWRNGIRRDLEADAKLLYTSPVIQSERGSGVVEINAGGESFRIE